MPLDATGGDKSTAAAAPDAAQEAAQRRPRRRRTIDGNVGAANELDTIISGFSCRREPINPTAAAVAT